MSSDDNNLNEQWHSFTASYFLLESKPSHLSNAKMLAGLDRKISTYLTLDRGVEPETASECSWVSIGSG
jgi:hypothetical protein